jgi:hypothetical protein
MISWFKFKKLKRRKRKKLKFKKHRRFIPNFDKKKKINIPYPVIIQKKCLLVKVMVIFLKDFLS